MSLNTFMTSLTLAQTELLESAGQGSRNPSASWDGGHFKPPGLVRPLSISATEARFLANFTVLLDCQTILEVGTGFGYSTTWLARGLSLCSAPKKVHTVDNGTESSLGGRGLAIGRELWARTGVSDLIRTVFGTSPGILESMGRLDADVAFIDGEHRGGQPLLDYRAVVRHLAPTGCIVFHDVQAKYDVKDAVSEAESDGFHCFPLNTSCEPVVAVRDPTQYATISIALSLARRGLLLEADGYASIS